VSFEAIDVEFIQIDSGRLRSQRKSLRIDEPLKIDAEFED